MFASMNVKPCKFNGNNGRKKERERESKERNREISI